MCEYPVKDPTMLERRLFDAGLVQEVALEEIYDIKGRTSIQQEWQTKEVACRQPDPLDPASWDDKLIAGRRGAFFVWAMSGCSRVLDVGCGEGWPSLYLAREVPEVHGLDCSKVHIDLACRTAGLMGLANVQFHVGRIESLPFPDQHFDGICFGGNVLTYRTDPQVLLAEIQRVLKPSGPFALEQWPIDGSQGRWEKMGFFIDNGPPILHYVAGSGPFSRTYFVHIREDSAQGRHLLAVADRADGSELSPAQREGCEQVKQQLEAGDLGTVETVIYGGQDRSLIAEELPKLLAGAGFEDFASWAIPSGRSIAKELKQVGLLQRFQSQDVRPCIRALVRSACRTSNWVHQWVTVRKGKQDLAPGHRGLAMDVMLKQIYGPEDPWCHVFEGLARPYMVETAAGEKIDNEAFIKSILQRQGSSTRWLMLIMSGSQVAGFAHYKISDEDPTLGDIYEFYVTPGVRCRGIVTRALLLWGTRNLKRGYAAMRRRFDQVLEIDSPNGLIEDVMIGRLGQVCVSYASV